MSLAAKWPLRAIAAAGCVLSFLLLPHPSTGQMPGAPQHMMSNPNDLDSAAESDEGSSSKEDKKARKAEKKAEKERKKAEKEARKSGEASPATSDGAARGSNAAAPVAVPFTAVANAPGTNRSFAAAGKKICGEKPKPITVGSNAKVGSGARAKSKALSTLGGLLGGGGGGGGKGKDGPPLVKCKIKDKEMTLFTDPGTGTSLKVGAKTVGDTVNVFAEVAKSPDSGTFQTAYLNPPGESPQVPREVGICGLWGEWSLTVSWTKTTYVDGQKVSEEKGGYHKAGSFDIPGTLSSDAAPAGLWKQMGFSNASHGAKEIAMQYKAPAAFLAGQPVNMVIHVTRPGEDPVTTAPFNLLMTKTADGVMFQQAPDENCPDDADGPLMAGNDDDDGGAGVQEEDRPPPACEAGKTCVAVKDPCEERLRRARDRLDSRPQGGDDFLEAARERVSQEERIARDIAAEASMARYDLEQAARRAEDTRREAEFRQGLYEKFGTHQQGQTAAYGELADAARQMGDSMEARAADAENRAAGWDASAERYGRLAKTTDDPGLADAARQAADNAREEARKLREQAAEYREQAKKDYERSGERTQSGERIQADTDKMAKDAKDAGRAADEARALEECLKRVVAQLDAMAAAQAQAAQDAARKLAQRPPEQPADGPKTTTRPPTSGPMTPTPPPATVASVDGGSTPCPWPSGKISVHMVDAEVYTPLLYGTSDSFTGLSDMVAQLQAKVAPHYDPRGLCGKCIEQLDVWGHGDTGGGYISFGPNDAQIGNTSMGATFDQDMAALAGLMCVGGKVVINQCKAGTGKKGAEALQALADKIGVPVSGPTDKIKGCRIFGGLFTGYKEQTPGPNAKTPGQNQAGPVSAPP